MMEEESECGRVIWVCLECCFYLVRLDDGQRREVHACLTVKISAPDQDTIRAAAAISFLRQVLGSSCETFFYTR